MATINHETRFWMWVKPPVLELLSRTTMVFNVTNWPFSRCFRPDKPERRA
jgi:hypothetical protein